MAGHLFRSLVHSGKWKKNEKGSGGKLEENREAGASGGTQ